MPLNSISPLNEIGQEGGRKGGQVECMVLRVDLLDHSDRLFLLVPSLLNVPDPHHVCVCANWKNRETVGVGEVMIWRGNYYYAALR